MGVGKKFFKLTKCYCWDWPPYRSGGFLWSPKWQYFFLRGRKWTRVTSRRHFLLLTSVIFSNVWDNCRSFRTYASSVLEQPRSQKFKQTRGGLRPVVNRRTYRRTWKGNRLNWASVVPDAAVFLLKNEKIPSSLKLVPGQEIGRCATSFLVWMASGEGQR